MTEGEAPDENCDAGQNGIEEIEGAHRADTNEIEQRTFHAHVRERLVQTLKDAICTVFLLRFVSHIVLV
jgi:hypothetical protein